MALIISNMLINACVLTLIVLAFQRKDKRLFLSAWALYGFMDIYWGLPYAIFYRYYGIPTYPIARLEGFANTSYPYFFQCLLGFFLVVASYSLYQGNKLAYYFIRAYCYFLGFVFALICPVGIFLMAYYIFIKHAAFPIFSRLPGTCNSIITICIIIYSVKFLNTIRPKTREKTIKPTSEKAEEDISCPECGNIIPAHTDICNKCNWTYQGKNEI
jgi:hypothetical protein